MVIAMPTITTATITSRMPARHKPTSFPRRREPTTPGGDPSDSCVDPRLRGDDGALEDVSAAALSRLMTWLSPAFPVGGFSYSHGLEWVVEQGGLRDATALGGWIEDALVHGAGRTDLILLAQAWRAVSAGDAKLLADTAELAAAFTPSAERRLETVAQGTAFLKATQAVWPHPALEALAADGAEVAYPVAVGAAAAAHGLALVATAQAFCQAFAANLVSAGVRLIPLGQTDGLRVISRIEPLIPILVAEALAAGPDDIGGAAIAADIASMRHETQYTRLFRS
jgi:urease accessory protein